jgi:hypothetical protein
MEIRGSWIPLDVLKYITQFLWVKDHREDFKRVCRTFYRALKEDPPKPPVFIVPKYGSAQCGLVTIVKKITCYANKLIVQAYKWSNHSVYFRFRDDTRLFRVSSTTWNNAFDYSRLCVYAHDLMEFCPQSGHFGMQRQLHNADREEIIQEMTWLFYFALQQLWECFEHVNKRKLLKHKRPRKRVKRLGFDD